MAGVRSILIPSSITVETTDPKLATYKVGLVGRAAAIFGVDEIVVYEDEAHPEARRIARILQYQATAPYLRKRLFPLSDELAHVGVLPPLNLPLHLVPPAPETGELRLATALGRQAHIGLEAPAELELAAGASEPEPGTQFLVRVKHLRGQRIQVEGVEPAEAGIYPGFSVSRAPSLKAALKFRGPFVGTSRGGEPLATKHLAPEGVALIFGSPLAGVEELLGETPRFPVVNTIPDQQTRTVRTEEAVLVSLGVVHALAKGGLRS